MNYLNKNYTFSLIVVTSVLLLSFQRFLLAENDKKDTKDFADKHGAFMTGEVKDYFVKGNNYWRNGQYQLAIETFEKLLQINPNYAKAYDNLGGAYYSSGQSEKAINSYQKSIQIDSRSAVPYQGLGIVYAGMGQYQEALNYFQKAVEIDNNYAAAYQGLGCAYHSLNKYREAKENLNKAKDLLNRKGDYKTASEIDSFLKNIP